MEEEKKRQGTFQHRVFKFCVLTIAAIFCYFIASFVYIEFLKKKPQSNISHILEMNAEKYEYLYKRDRDFHYSLDNINVDTCDIKNFYYEQISLHRPCIFKLTSNKEYTDYYSKTKSILDKASINSNDKEIKLQGYLNEIGVLEFANVMEFDGMYIVNPKEISIPKLTSKAYILIQIQEESDIALSPITQINKLKPFKNETYQTFNPIYAGENLFELHDKKSSATIMKTRLQEGELLFVPSYFFIHMRGTSRSSILKFEFNTGPRTLDTMFRILYDDQLETQEE